MSSPLPGQPPTVSDLSKLAQSGISEDLTAQAQIYRVDSAEGKRLVGGKDAYDYAGTVYPYFWPGSSVVREVRLLIPHDEIARIASGGMQLATRPAE